MRSSAPRRGGGGRGRGNIPLGDHLVTRTASPTRHYPATEHRPQHGNNARSGGAGSAVDLRVTGWLQSRVANEPDGGVATLSAWLERKAQTALDKDANAAAQSGVQKRRHTARIRKVCLIRPLGV
jgi:hypothetical protein